MIFTSKFIEIYYHILQARYLEEALAEEYKKGTTNGPLHLCTGQEAAAAACGPLKKEDVIVSTHRCHAHYVGKGMDLKRLCCEIYGKKEGYCKGRAGHMLIWDRELGILGAMGIVGGSIPIAVGQALSFQIRGEDRVVVSFFGDGASNTGSFHESLNMAAKWKLPVVFYCENNQYGLTTHVDDHLSVKDISERAKAYGIPGITVFGNDMVKVYNAVDEGVSRARSGEGPMLIEAKTYRMFGYSTGDTAWLSPNAYQREEEIEFWRKNDCIDIGEKLLTDQGECTKGEIGKLKQKALAEVKEAIIYAQNAPYPDPLDLPKDVFQREEVR